VANPNTQIEALKRLETSPLDGPSWTIQAFASNENLSVRQVHSLIEAGEVAAVRRGRVWIIPDAARQDFLRRLIQARIQELELMEG